MADKNDMDLMREYVDRNSEPAFAELVHRHINLVYSVALRCVGNAPDAQDVTQVVFIILAKKITGLRQRMTLTGWFYETTRFTARQLLRRRSRQQAREQEAYMQSTLNDSDTGNIWRQLAPFLEEAMARLNEKERALMALRFYENKSGAEAAALLGIREPAAHKRTARAVEKLRAYLARRGLRISTGALIGVVSAHSVQAAPTGLAVTISAAAVKGSAVAASTLTLAKGILKLMAWTKTKTAVVIGAGILLAAGTTTITIKKIQADRGYDWQVPRFNSQTFAEIMKNTSPLVRIVPTKFSEPGPFGSDGQSFLGIGVSLTNILTFAYTNSTTARTVFETDVPPGRFDFIANVPGDSSEALKQEIKKQFGLVGKFETRYTDVLVLKVRRNNAAGLKPAAGGRDGLWLGNNEFSCQNQSFKNIAALLEAHFGTPIIDQTGLDGRYDFDLHWQEQEPPQNLDGLKQALLDQLGLELVPANLPIEMLVVDKQKD